jgi:hypothetical protein
VPAQKPWRAKLVDAYINDIDLVLVEYSEPLSSSWVERGTGGPAAGVILSDLKIQRAKALVSAVESEYIDTDSLVLPD